MAQGCHTKEVSGLGDPQLRITAHTLIINTKNFRDHTIRIIDLRSRSPGLVISVAAFLKMNNFTEVMMQTLPHVLSDGNSINEGLFPMMIRSILNEKAGREFFRHNSRFTGNTGIPAAPTISEDDIAFLEDSNNFEAIAAFENRKRRGLSFLKHLCSGRPL